MRVLFILLQDVIVQPGAFFTNADDVASAVVGVHGGNPVYLRDIWPTATIGAPFADFYEDLPKPCMGGWGRTAMVVAPHGDVLPCQAASTIPGLEFANVRELQGALNRLIAHQTLGGGVWQNPAIDLATNRLYFVVGNPPAFQALKPPAIEITFWYPSFCSVSTAIAERTPAARSVPTTPSTMAGGPAIK